MRGSVLFCLALATAWGAASHASVVVAEGRFESTAPAWSPDGRLIAYVIRKGSDRDLWVVGANGKNARRLASGVARGSEAEWAPDSGRIAIVLGKPKPDLVVLQIAGTEGPVSLEEKLRLPCWRPDGRALAATDGKDVFLADLAGKTAPLTHEATPGVFHGLAWSPDGKWIASDRNGDISIVPARKGATWRVVASHGAGASAPLRSPIFSADGRFIYYTIDRAGVYDAAAGSDGIGRVDLVVGKAEVVCEGASWSLGGSNLALERGGSVWVRNMGTGKEREVARGSLPALSGDGGSLAYVVESDTNGDGRIDFRDRRQLVVAEIGDGGT